MIIDNLLELADGTWAPTATGDNISPNVIDTSPLGGSPTANGGRNLGEGEGLYVVVTVKTAVTSAGAATVDFQIVTDSSSAMGSKVELAGTGAIGKASLVAGKQIKIKLPNDSGYKQYLAVNASIGTAVLTAGAFQVDIVKDLSSNSKYAGAYSIS